jgi:SLOG family YspA-like protein
MALRPFRVLVCGGRKFTDKALVYRTLDELAAEHGGVLYIIEGGQHGADSLARKWRHDRLQPGETFPADWDRYGDPAGPIRNHRMLAEGQPDLVLAFPGHTGTANMISQAERPGFRVPVRRVK